ncbi:MAG TPA: NAD(P)/FAD-dependent oxidoreductase [Mesotoga sp.]|nr:NAD(P)/FAD-dependent oxidoreductase [Mesotoga sp.]
MKLIVIGAGIAGLSAGIYGRLNGFDTEIYEMHTQPGGECTGWKRNGYYFDGCIHWLLGTKRGSSLNKVWREVGALDDTVKNNQSRFFLQL